MIQYISAVTFAVGEMARSIEFYRKLGFELLYGGDAPEFSSIAGRKKSNWLYCLVYIEPSGMQEIPAMIETA